MPAGAKKHAITSITAQIEELDVTARQHISVLKDLPRIRIRGRVAKYVLGSWMSPDGGDRVKNRSDIWSYGERLLEVTKEAGGQLRTHTEHWYCRLCDVEASKHVVYQTRRGTKVTTTTAKEHLELSLKGCHGLGNFRALAETAKEAGQTPYQAASRRERRRAAHVADLGPVPEESEDVGNVPTEAVVKAAKKALLELIVMCDFPISVTETPQFHALMNIFNAPLAKKLL